LLERIKRLEEQIQEEQVQEQREVKTFKGIAFTSDGILKVEEFVYQLTNQVVMQGISNDEQRIMVLVSGVTGIVSIWIRQ
jgi:hypothetical protein